MSKLMLPRTEGQQLRISIVCFASTQQDFAISFQPCMRFEVRACRLAHTNSHNGRNARSCKENLCSQCLR